jgi:membrane-associated phospholipid phosphatase
MSPPCLEHPWTDFGARASRLVAPAPLTMLGGAVAAPLVLAPTGVDQHVRVFFQRDLGGRYDAEAMSVTAPYALGAAALAGYGTSILTEDCAGSSFSSHALAAMGTAIAFTSTLKIVVGRSYLAAYTPPGGDRLVDDGRSTRATPFESFGAWPSGHATVTFAFAAVMREELASRPFYVRYSGYALATAVSFAMAYGDHHWASDLISGALIGEAFGRAFGGSLGDARTHRAHLTLVPTLSGAAVLGAF